jgi:hypothetical protein
MILHLLSLSNLRTLIFYKKLTFELKSIEFLYLNILSENNKKKKMNYNDDNNNFLFKFYIYFDININYV